MALHVGQFERSILIRCLWLWHCLPLRAVPSSSKLNDAPLAQSSSQDLTQKPCFTFSKLIVLQVPGNGSPAAYLDQAQKENALQSMQQMSSAQIVSATAMQNAKNMPIPGLNHPSVPYGGGFWQPGLQSQLQE